MVTVNSHRCDNWSIDTNVLITLRHQFPQDLYESFWEQMEEFANQGHWLVCDTVIRECRDAEWQSWFTAHPGIIAAVDNDYLTYSGLLATELDNNSMPLIDPSTTRHGADPFVIALALMIERRDPADLRKTTTSTRCGVLSQEIRKPSKMNIPSVCDWYGIPCMTIYEYMRQHGWKFSLVISSDDATTR